MNNKSVFIDDLENIYKNAMKNEQYSVALKAKELIGKCCGFWTTSKNKKLELSNLTDDELSELIESVEKQVNA